MRVRRWSVTVTGVALLVAAVAPAAIAGIYVGGSFSITDDDAADGVQAPVVAQNTSNGDYLVVWIDGRASGWGDVYGQRVKADGTPAGANFRISGDDATGAEYPVAVAYNSVADQYLVVWQDERDYTNRGYDIYGRRLKASGALAGDEFRISSEAATGLEGAPAVAHNPVTNQYLVVWTDYRNNLDRGPDVYGQRIKATGVMAGDEFRISDDAATGAEYRPQVVCNTATGQFLVVWEDDRLAPTWEIFGRRMKGGGKLAGDDFPISEPGTSDSQAAAVAYNSIRNQYLVVWEDNRNYLTTSHDIYGRRVKGAGRLAGDDFRIGGDPLNGEWEKKPQVAYDATNDRYFVVWEDYRDYDTRGDEVYGRRLKGSGKLFGDDKRINGGAALDDDNDPVVAYNPITNEFLVVWVDVAALDIVAQRIKG